MEETGWKLVHGDVFRPPQRAWLLTAFVGSGVQIFCMVLITLGRYLVNLFNVISYDYRHLGGEDSFMDKEINDLFIWF